MSMTRMGTASWGVVGEAPRSALDAGLWALDAGLWPVAITPWDSKGQSPGKRPIGNAWGTVRPTHESWKATFARNPGAGVGLLLGSQGDVVDIDVDQPDVAVAALARLFPDRYPPTLRWENESGRFHMLFRYDARLASIGKAIIQGKRKDDGSTVGNPLYLGLEVRIGASAEVPKQIQSVIPPSFMATGSPRKWVRWGDLLDLPESVVLDLIEHGPGKPAAPTVQARRGERPATIPFGGFEDRWTPVARAEKYLEGCQGAVEGQKGSDQTLKVAVQIGPGFNLDPETAYSLMRDLYNPKCEPPWSEKDLRRKVDEAYRVESLRGWKLTESRSITPPSPLARKTAEPQPESPDVINLTDTGNSLRLVRDHGRDLRYCVQWGKWLKWDGRRWEEDTTGEVYRLAKKTVQRIGIEAANVDDSDQRKPILKWAIQSEARKHIDSMIHLGRFVEGVPVETSELDADPWLLNVRNGTIDLRTGQLRPHRQEDLITKLADVDYDPNATCPRWDRFELEIMDQDESMVSYIGRIAGYAITGDVREHQLYFFHGEGRNGKSLWLGIIHRILNDYATTINSSVITVKQHEDHPTWLTDLEKRRFVSTIEVADGRKMAEALVKQLTGGDPIKARRMRQDHYSFMPTHKIILAANHKPDIRETGEAMWERVKLIPFPVTFVEADRVNPAEKRLLKDKGLEQALWSEAPGILASLVRGCLEWQRDGLKEPDTVVKATKDYRSEMDSLTDFIEERCIVGDGVRVKTNDLYEAYKAWAKSSGEHEMTKKKFGNEMSRRGLLPISWSSHNGNQGCGCSSGGVSIGVSFVGTYLSHSAAYSDGVR